VNRILVVLLALGLIIAGSAGSAQADGRGPVVLVVDDSGSMNAADLAVSVQDTVPGARVRQVTREGLSAFGPADGGVLVLAADPEGLRELLGVAGRCRETVTPSDGASLTLYGLRTYPDGRLAEYRQFGHAPSKVFGPAARDWLRSHMGARLLTAGGEDPGLLAAGWSLVYQGTSSHYKDPWGEIGRTTDYEFLTGDNNSTYDWWDTHHFMCTTAGSLKYGSDWQTAKAWVFHDIDYADSTHLLTKWGPTTTNANSTYSVSIGVSAGIDGASVSCSNSWSRTLPDVSVVDQSIKSYDDAKWREDYVKDCPAARNTFTFEPGAQARIPDGRDFTGRIEYKGEFRDYHWWGGYDGGTLTITVDYTMWY